MLHIEVNVTKYKITTTGSFTGKCMQAIVGDIRKAIEGYYQAKASCLSQN
jgi:hypothetical protein